MFFCNVVLLLYETNVCCFFLHNHTSTMKNFCNEEPNENEFICSFLVFCFFMSQSSEALNNKDKHFSAIFLIICSVYSVQDTYRYLFFALKMNLKPGFVFRKMLKIADFLSMP